MQITQLNLDAIIQDIKLNLPEFLRATDLIASGLYKSRSDLCWSMKRGRAPPYIKLSTHKVVFPRAGLIKWLTEKTRFNQQDCDVCA